MGNATNATWSSERTGCNEQAYAKLVLEADEVMKTLSTFATIIQEICKGHLVTMEGLLTADTFNLTYSWRNVITKITRETETQCSEATWRSDN